MMFRPMMLSASLAAALLSTGCGTPPADLDLSLSKTSASGLYRVTLEPPAPMPPINQMHSWKVKLATAEGAAVRDARFKVGGGMPQHGHGLPTQPRVTRELEPGTYLIEGMKFSMNGWWNLDLALEGSAGADKVSFNTVLGNSAR